MSEKIDITKSSRIGRVYDLSARTITFTVPGASGGPLVLRIDSVSPACREYAVYHGFGQRIGDAAAIERAANGGRTASPEAKWNALKILVDHYSSGSDAWSPKRSDSIGSDELLLARALSIVYPQKDAEKIRSHVSGLTRAQRTALMTQNAEIKAAVELIQAEQSKDVDVEGLLEGL
jgi:hypothetical protein